ncbi:MAG: phage head closure protein [Sarcina sp.]
MKKINPGEFRHNIQIQRYICGINDDGIPVEKWENILTMKAKVSNVKFEEILLAQGEGVQDIKTFCIRFRKNIKRVDRVIFNNEIYNIKSLNDIENKGVYLVIKGELVE